MGLRYGNVLASRPFCRPHESSTVTAPQEPTAGEIVRDWLDMAERAPVTSCKVLRHPPICQSEIDAIRSLVESRAPASVAAEGEAVAWRYRQRNPDMPGWSVTMDQSISSWPNLIVEPLYAHPARMPTRQQVQLKIHEWIRDRTTTSLKSAITPDQIDPLADMMIALFTDTRGA